MADPRSLTHLPQKVATAGHQLAVQFSTNTRGNDISVAMEQSASSSSIASSVSSLLTSSSSTSVELSSYLPVTPKHTFQPLHPTYNIYNEMDSKTNLSGLAGSSMATNALISPPEAEKLDTFEVDNNQKKHPVDVGTQEQHHLDPGTASNNTEKNLVSPPISPALAQKSDATAQGTQDPILYPAASDTAASALQSRPLFSDAAVSSHAVNPKNTRMFKFVESPNGRGTGQIKSQMMLAFQRSPNKWLEMLKKEHKEDAERRRANQQTMISPPQPSASRPASSPLARRNPCHRQEPSAIFTPQKSASHRDHARLVHPVQTPDNRVMKRAARAVTSPRATRPTHIAPQLNGTSRQVSSNHGAKRVSGSSPEPRVRNAAPNREDKDFNALPDYCPPLSTLPERTNNLKVDWKGTPLDLSNDPFLHLMHRDEVGLAASLRLDCATYLTSKRRIFIRRLECARIPKEFRKTDAQQACKIDVNKASKLWTAYDKVGWLKAEHIRRFM